MSDLDAKDVMFREDTGVNNMHMIQIIIVKIATM
jgi:hypothetical protein